MKFLFYLGHVEGQKPSRVELSTLTLWFWVAATQPPRKLPGDLLGCLIFPPPNPLGSAPVRVYALASLGLGSSASFGCWVKLGIRKCLAQPQFCVKCLLLEIVSLCFFWGACFSLCFFPALQTRTLHFSRYPTRSRENISCWYSLQPIFVGKLISDRHN